MLDIALKLATIAATLFSIVEPNLQIEIDGLNSPTAKPILGGSVEI